MAIIFHPKAGMVLMCDFKGYREPEIIKTRPVAVISPNHLGRPGLVTIVPLSTTAPNPVCAYHYRLLGNPIPGDAAPEVWAKCDLVATVCLDRLDRVQLGRGRYEVGYVSMDQIRAMRIAAAHSFGIEPPAP
jgi:mRNA interferase MazF